MELNKPKPSQLKDGGKGKDKEAMTGIKLLLKLKSCQKAYDDYVSNGSIDQYFNDLIQNEEFMNRLMNETIEDEGSAYIHKEKGIELDYMNEKSSRMISDVDRMIREITETRRQIELNKDLEKVKTKEDFLAYMNIKPNGDKENAKDKEGRSIERVDNYKQYIIRKDGEKEKRFDEIKERLHEQEIEIKDKKTESIQIEMNMAQEKREKEMLKYSDNHDDTDKLFEEIRLANSRMDSFLNELDECIELNEKIDKGLDEQHE